MQPAGIALGQPSKSNNIGTRIADSIEESLMRSCNRARDQIARLRDHNDSWFGAMPKNPEPVVPGNAVQIPLPPPPTPQFEVRITRWFEELSMLQQELEEEISRASRI